MTFPVLGGNSAIGGYEIANSLRFNDNDNAYLSKTLSASPTNQKIVSFSFWAKRGNLGVYSYNLVGNTSAPYVVIGFLNDDTFSFQLNAGSGSTGLITSAKFRDTSAWYHTLCVLDTTQGTASNRMKMYINGVQVTDFGTANYPAQNSTWNINTNVEHSVGGSSAIQDFDGYMAEVNFIDGQALSPTDFGEFDTDSGIWKPKQFSGSYGTNGFYLDFENSGSLGADSSPNGNNFTPTNLASTDQTTDTPTNNFATMNPLFRSRQANNGVFSEGNTKLTYTASNDNKGTILSTIGVSSGKWYWEVKVLTASREMIGVGYDDVSSFSGAFHDSSPSKGFSIFAGNGNLYFDATNTAYGSSFSVNDIIMVALDMDNHLCWFGKNGTWFDSATQSEIENGTATNDATTQMGTQQNLNSGEPVFPLFADTSASGQASFEANFGNPPFSISSGNTDDNGYGNFEYAPPSGYLALCTQNLATALSPTIDDGSAYFQTALWTGTGSSLEITNDGNSDLQPDFFWGKSRSNGSGHTLIDSSRGLTKYLVSNDTAGDATDSTTITSFNTDGFTLGTDGSTTINYPSRTYVGWQWKANGGTTSSNTDGSITSTVQANTTAGFSIVTYTGTGANATVGHSLGVKPDMVIVKNRSSSTDWGVQMANTLGFTNALRLNLTDAYGGSNGAGWWNDTAPTTTTVSIGTRSEVNTSGNNYVMYCFNNVEGYSKFGSYTGNGSTDGAFVYTGFRPAFVMIKNASRGTAGAGWFIWDKERNTFNVVDNYLLAQSSNAEGNFDSIDFTSNGFKLRTSDGGLNASGETIIYMAFAESPFVTSSGVPVVAR